jgi:molybdate transport system ATP-binding protein
MTAASALRVDVRVPLDRFDLDVAFVAASRVTGIFGPSGAGKTTLLRVIAGLKRRSAEGIVRLGEETWLDTDRRIYLPPEARQIGYVPQEGLLFPHLDVRQNLLSGSARAQRNGHAPVATFETVCDLLEVRKLLDRETATLSAGERQRVALGRAICSGPRLLLLDEPLASLDLPLRRRVLPFLRRVRSEFEVPMLLVSHDPTEVQALCDEVIALRDGAVVAQGPTRQVLTDPRVLALSDEDGFTNLLPGVVTARDGDSSEVRLGGADGEVVLVVPRWPGAAGDEVLVAVPAHEIIVAASEPGGLSARNVLPAVVEGVRDVGERRLVVARLAPRLPEVVVEVTARACEQLGLAAGRRVFLIIKTAGCRLLGPHGG